MAENQAQLPAGLGTHVELELINSQGQAEPMSIDIVPSKAAEIDRGLIGANTPLAKTIRGKTAGSTVPYGQGDIHSIRIVSVTPSGVVVSEEGAERRQAVLNKARTDAERTNAEIFAASFSGKWGDYNMGDATESDA